VPIRHRFVVRCEVWRKDGGTLESTTVNEALVLCFGSLYNAYLLMRQVLRIEKLLEVLECPLQTNRSASRMCCAIIELLDGLSRDEVFCRKEWYGRQDARWGLWEGNYI